MKGMRLREIAISTALIAGVCSAVLYARSGNAAPIEVSAAIIETHATSNAVPTGGSAVPAAWDAKAAAGYLDQRVEWWSGWDRAKRDQGTFCVSCHTVLPYTLARPALRKMIGEKDPGEDERLILANVVKRVRLWNELAPVYSDEKYGKNKGVESRGTESVLLAFVLANRDAQSGTLSDDTKAALEHLWQQQQKDGERKGAWLWQMFGLNPWEGDISPYYGATLAAAATGMAPENYRVKPEIQNNIKLLREYLNREFVGQPLVNRVMLLWAETKLPGLIEADRQKAITQEILRTQQEDGGWNLFRIASPMIDPNVTTQLNKFKRLDGSPQELGSDGFATGLMVFVLKQSGDFRESDAVKRGRAWLEKNQNRTEGSWTAYSVNKKRELSSDAGRFMNDAATAYAILALTN